MKPVHKVKTAAPTTYKDEQINAQRAVLYYRACKSEDEYESILSSLRDLHRRWRDRRQQFRKPEGIDDDLSDQLRSEKEQLREMRRLAENLDDAGLAAEIENIEKMSDVVNAEVLTLDPMSDIDTLTGDWDVRPYGAPPGLRKPKKRKRAAAASWSAQKAPLLDQYSSKIEAILARAIQRAQSKKKQSKSFKGFYKARG